MRELKSNCGFNRLRHGQVRAHAQEKGKNHIVDKDGLNEQVYIFLHGYSVFKMLISAFIDQ